MQLADGQSDMLINTCMHIYKCNIDRSTFSSLYSLIPLLPTTNKTVAVLLTTSRHLAGKPKIQICKVPSRWGILLNVTFVGIFNQCHQCNGHTIIDLVLSHISVFLFARSQNICSASLESFCASLLVLVFPNRLPCLAVASHRVLLVKNIVFVSLYLKRNFYGGICCLPGWIHASVQSDESTNLQPRSTKCLFLLWHRKTAN